jgi:hypothetical protein
VSVSKIICPSYGAVGRVLDVHTPGRMPVALLLIVIIDLLLVRQNKKN